MIKFFFTFLILLLIFFTAFIKNSTKRIDDEIFVVKENIRILKKDFENVKLEHNFLGSTERLAEFKKLYFDESWQFFCELVLIFVLFFYHNTLT